MERTIAIARAAYNFKRNTAMVLCMSESNDVDKSAYVNIIPKFRCDRLKCWNKDKEE